MTHMYKMLRGTCLYCHRLRVGDETLVKFAGALQYLEYGMVQPADDLLLQHPRGLSAAELLGDGSGLRSRKDKNDSALTQDDGDGAAIHLHNQQEQPHETVAEFVERINAQVRDTINAHLKLHPSSREQTRQDNATFDCRKNIIREFFAEINKRKQCPHCNAYVSTHPCP